MAGIVPRATFVHPETYLFSLYARYVVPRGEDVWIGTLIQALGTLDFRPAAVRAIVSRLQRKGYLAGRRAGRCSFYRLTEQGQGEVGWGTRRAFAPEGEWDGCWTLVTYSIPEPERRRRDALREALKHWGFGPLSPGTWVSPRPLPHDAEPILHDLGVWGYLELFRGQYHGAGRLRALVSQAWPLLPALGERYRDYLTRYELVRQCCQAGVLQEEACFAAQLQGLVEYVAITLEDPSLPATLLDEDWPRPAVESLYGELDRLLREPAGRFFDRIYRTAAPCERGGGLTTAPRRVPAPH